MMFDLDPFTVSVFGAVARWLATLIVGFFVAHHIITVDQTAAFTDGFAHKLSVALPLLAPLAWSIWRKYGARVKFLTAIESTSEDQVTAKIANGRGASITAGALLLVCGLAASAVVSTGCAATRPPAGTYSTAGLKAFDADQAMQDVTALWETAKNLNATAGPRHLSDRDTAIVRDFALSAGAGLLAYGNGQGPLSVVVAAFAELARTLSAEAALNDKLRYVLALVETNIHRIPGQ